MKPLRHCFAEPSRTQPPHLLLIAVALTAAFMLATATEIGPVAPFIISLAMYLIVFCGITWFLVALRALVRMAAKKYLVFSHAKVVV